MAKNKELSDEETYLKKYDNLSRGEKQELDLAKRKRLAQAQAEADAGDSFGQRVSDTTGRMLRGLTAATGVPSAAKKQAEEDAYTAKRKSERERRLQDAKDSAAYKERDRALYPSKTPGKIDDNMIPLKTGGKVSSASKRADGCAQRGKTRA
jgi:hypothetical protein